MKKKKVLLISCGLLILFLITIVIFNNMGNNENDIISNINKNEQVINKNMITMMYETDAGTGIYEETKDTTWPESGYIFNENLSGCENGGELEYNSENNTVNLLSNSSDRCYVYFDKYDGVWIDGVSITNVNGSSVTLDVSATSENGSISNYYYSLNDSEYVSTNINPIVIENLNQLTEYNISIYVVDSTNAKSNTYELNVSTTDISVPVINSVEVSNITYNSFTITVNATSDIGISKYYYVIESENISGVSDNNTYSFVNLNSGIPYNVNVFIRDINGNFSNVYSLSPVTNDMLLTEWIISQYNGIQGNNGLYYHTSSLANSAADNSYRYAGANPNNYVCFGSDELTCPSDNLYRIIGVFGNEVKLMKNTSIGNYYWGGSSSNQSNIWRNSTLNTNVLNNTFLNNFSSMWQNEIVTHNWKVGGISPNAEFIAKQYYDRELGSTTTYDAKIGLIYASDYGYAANNSYWTYSLRDDYSDNTVRNNNWMFLGVSEWTISRYSSGTYISYCIYSSGIVYSNNIYLNDYAVRPAFYLKSDVQYASGSGTQSDPIRIKID